MDAKTRERETRIRSLTELVAHFDPTNPVHAAHYNSLKSVFGEMAAAMLVSQDVAQNARRGGGMDLELTDPGAIGSHPYWKSQNRVVIHGSVARYTVFDFDAETKAGGRLVPMFTRDQTVPAYAQD